MYISGKKTEKKSLFWKVIISVVIIAGLVIALEMSLREAPAGTSKPAFEPDPELFWKLAPSLTNYPLKIGDVTTVIDTNTSCMRNEEVDLKGDPERNYRIVCLGDESTFGSGVPQNKTYPEVLQGMIKKKFHFFIPQVFNAGVTGYSSYQAKTFLEKYCIQYKPDIVVVSLLHNDMDFENKSDKDRVSYNRFVNPVRDELFNLKLFMGIRNYLVDKAYAESMEDSKRSEYRVQPVDYGNNLKDIVRIAQRAKARVIIINPQKDKSQKETYQYRKKLKYIAETSGSYLVDLEEIFDRQEDYYLNNRVPSAEGHEAIAQKLFSLIRYSALIPQGPGGQPNLEGGGQPGGGKGEPPKPGEMGKPGMAPGKGGIPGQHNNMPPPPGGQPGKPPEGMPPPGGKTGGQSAPGAPPGPGSPGSGPGGGDMFIK